MPPNSLIIGVDLAPIKPIPRAITFQGDITTDKCRATIRTHLKTWKADTVLHDGAPNVGTAWNQDAFSQAELTLQAMKLATDFLGPGGTFVTKVFRSKDYNSLLWVFNQLFNKVEATKPPSSRNVSAEIFVVCRGFKAPQKIDPQFLDPRAVFAELTAPTPNNEAKVFNPEKKKRKREGYDEGDYTQFKQASASEFIQTTDPIAMLGTLNKLSFEQANNGDIALAALNRLPETTQEIMDCCEDLKVLGRKEFRILLKWRLKVREIFGLATKKNSIIKEDAEQITEIAPLDDDLAIEEELQNLNDKEIARRKKERRKENEKRQKESVRMQLHMQAPTDIGLDQLGPQGQDSIFNLVTVKNAKADLASQPRDFDRQPEPADSEENTASDDDLLSDDEEDKLDSELDAMYQQYTERKSQADTKYRAKIARQEREEDDNWDGFGSGQDDDDDDDANDSAIDMASADSGDEVLHIKDKKLEIDSNGLTTRASRFFSNDIFKTIDGLDDEEDGSLIDVKKTVLTERSKIGKMTKDSLNGVESNKTQVDQYMGDSDVDSDYEEDDKEHPDNQNPNKLESSDLRADGRLDIDIITAEAMTLAHQLASGQKHKDDVIDDGFNKYSFRDVDGLPEWFLDDERKHSKPHKPITAAAAAAIKEKLRAMNARPIKKVREAKDRKKLRAARRLEKMKQKSAMLAEDDAATEQDKANSIAKLMGKASKKKPRQQVKLVVARGGNRGVSGRPRGVKGKYKIVDPRLKKDTRAIKRLAKKRAR